VIFQTETYQRDKHIDCVSATYVRTHQEVIDQTDI